MEQGKFNVKIDEPLATQIRVYCARLQRTYKDVFSIALDEYIKRELELDDDSQ